MESISRPIPRRAAGASTPGASTPGASTPGASTPDGSTAGEVAPEKRDEGSPDDPMLLERIAGGDEAALGLLYDRHAGLLLALARRVLDEAGEAEEVLQEVFLQVWNQADRYQRARSSVSTWLVLITRSRAIDRLRSRQVVDRTLATLQQRSSQRHTSPEGAAAVFQGERHRRLARELEALPAEQRQVLELAFYRGLTQSEIAAVVEIPLGTVKTRTLLAMKKLRRALQDEIRDLL